MAAEQCGQGLEWCKYAAFDDNDKTSPLTKKSKKRVLTWGAHLKYFTGDESSAPVSSKNSYDKCSTPKSSKSDSCKPLLTKGKRLDFDTCTSESSKDSGEISITATCCDGTEIPVLVRDVRNVEDIGCKPEKEVYDLIAEDIPIEAQKFIIKRKASVLPYKCPKCGRWCPPLYTCMKCHALMWGIHLYEHEQKCSV